VAVVALCLFVAWLVVVSAVPIIRFVRAGDRVPLPAPAAPGSAAWWAKALGTAGTGLAIAAPVAELLGVEPFRPLGDDRVGMVGIGVVVLGTAGILLAQRTMGASWRPDVDPSARPPLVTDGPFGVVRNPVLACTLLAQAGFFLIVPNVVSLLMLAAVVSSAQAQVRLVEEPHLARTHGEAYAAYARRTGRFIPWVGRLPSVPPRAGQDR
jgi:protein-S-isoprenylcysteine O-methyltransferase Ste14